MKLTEAHFDLDGRSAVFRDGEQPTLAIDVDNFDDARDLLDTLKRSRARKKAVPAMVEPEKPEAANG